jgi:two-component system, NtrC family, nitrogen regulation sensor histidine kinase NtrY
MSATEQARAVALQPVFRFLGRLRRFHLGSVLGVVLAITAIVAVSGTFAAIRGQPPFGGDPDRVLLWLYADLIVLLLLAIVIAWRVVALWVERRRGSAGSRLHIRLVVLFGFISVVPAIIVAVASVILFNF